MRMNHMDKHKNIPKPTEGKTDMTDAHLHAAASRHYDALFAIARNALNAIAALQRDPEDHAAFLKRSRAAMRRIRRKSARFAQEGA